MKAIYSSAVPDKYKFGMWAFVLHRVSGLVIAAYGVAHIIVISTSMFGGTFDTVMENLHKPWVVSLELLLILAVLYHGLNGIRLLLFDIGIGIRQQKPLFWGLMSMGVIIAIFVANAMMPSITGGSLF
ncbi:MAG: succinate dehydrogenase, cytochrome b556 subunit [Chloroflexi bacterium]|nr:succinate dehydrogenase, cytochrome b556 subunit [Chloroflexota bacterium]